MTHVDHLIIGTGFAGIAMAAKLKQAGISDFAVLEKAASIGGAWRDNHYPGCACDVQSHLYSFSFAPNPNWSRNYAPQPEIQAYIENTAKQSGLLPHIIFNHGVKQALYNQDNGRWQITCNNGKIFSCKTLITGIGGLHIPNIPNLPGIENFKGEVFHSAQWNHNFDYSNKKVAVIGTGASAIQFIPELAKSVNRLTLFQRTAPWVLPKPDRDINDSERKLYNRFPFLQRIMRAYVYFQMEMLALPFLYQPKILGHLEPLFLRHLKNQVKDKALREKLTPSFRMGCKRVLISNNYYPALTQNNVTVNTQGIQSVTENSVIDNQGQEHKVDAIIYGTGFKAGDSFSAIDIQGKNGQSLTDAWQSGSKTYAGVNVSGFPNLHMVLGPNTGLSQNSFVYMIESQTHYILQAIKKMQKKQWKSIDVKTEMQEKFVEKVQSKSQGAIFLSGCQSWFLDNQGRNWNLWPDFSFKYRWATKRFNTSHYLIESETE